MDCSYRDQLCLILRYLRFFGCELITNPVKCAYLDIVQAAFTEGGMAREFHVSHEVTILGISLFVEGLGCGPLLVGPLSEVYGRSIIYRVSYGLFFIFSWPVAFAPNIGQYATTSDMRHVC
jgi:MFS family permease